MECLEKDGGLPRGVSMKDRFLSPFTEQIDAITAQRSTTPRLIGSLPRKEFSFKKKLFGKEPSARVEKTIEVTPGRRSLTVSLEDDDQGSRGLFTVSEAFRPGSRWTLRVDMPSAEAKPTAFLVQRK